jgi:hypothetical protein
MGSLFDGLSLSLDGLKRFAQSGSETVVNVRLPRHLINDVPILPYSKYQAEGYEILRDLQNDNIAIQEVYWTHLFVDSKKIQILYFVTDTKIYKLKKSCTQILSKYQLIEKAILMDKIEETIVVEHQADQILSSQNSKSKVKAKNDKSSNINSVVNTSESNLNYDLKVLFLFLF